MSDDEIKKKNYKIFIEQCHKIAVEHEEYCNIECFKNVEYLWCPHTKECVNMRKKHFESFVECNSIFCLKINQGQKLRPSYLKPKKKEEIIHELTYYSDSE
jgi:hypothetical protein